MGWRNRQLGAGAVVLVVGLGFATLAARTHPARAAEQSAPFGDLIVRYDGGIWDLTPEADGFTARCRHRDCDGRLVRGTVLGSPACTPGPSMLMDDAPRNPEVTMLERAGLSWRIEAWYRGCRNAHPRSLAACAVHGGRAYRVAAHLLSCRTAPLFGSEDRIVTLIRGIEMR